MVLFDINIFQPLTDITSEHPPDTKLSEFVANHSPVMMDPTPHKIQCPAPPRVQSHKHLPLDWSLKVKMRIVSEASLSWCTQLKMNEEARAVSQHVQRQHQVHRHPSLQSEGISPEEIE